MDPNASDSSQQKTSPNSDPAALMRLSTELTARPPSSPCTNTSWTGLLRWRRSWSKHCKDSACHHPKPPHCRPQTAVALHLLRHPQSAHDSLSPKNLMVNPPDAKASYSNARFSLANSTRCTPPTQAALLLCAHYSPGRRWSGSPLSGRWMVHPFPPSMHSSNISAMSSNIQPMGEVRGTNCWLSLKGGNRQPSTLCFSEHLQLRLCG